MFRTSAIGAVVVLVWALLVGRSSLFPVPPPRARFAVLVTGCSSGLGKDVVQELVKSDERTVVFAGLRDIGDAQTSLIQGLSPEQAKRVVPLQLDVTKQEQVDLAVKTVKEELARNWEGIPLYAVVPNAGIGGARSALEKDEGQSVIRKTMEVNVFGVVSVVNAFLPLLLQSPFGGRIINIGSLMGIVYTPKCYGYCSSKFALEALTMSWRYDLAPKNISVSIIEPGFFKSELCNKWYCKDDVSVCTKVVLASIFDERPYTRYTCASVYGIPSYLMPYIFGLAPDRVMDAFFQMTSPK